MREIDRDALLVALVIAPATYSRNRFFRLYTDPEMSRVRRRAAQIRSIVRHLARIDAGALAHALRVRPSEQEGRVEIAYEVAAIGLRRTATLDAIELSLVRFSLARAGERALAPDDPDRARVEAALRRLSPALATDEAAAEPS